MNDVLTWIADLPLVVVFFGTFVIGVIPFLESYVAALLGVLLALPWPFALVAAVIGNVAAVFVAVWAGARVAGRQQERERTERKQKLLDRTNKYGIPSRR